MKLHFYVSKRSTFRQMCSLNVWELRYRLDLVKLSMNLMNFYVQIKNFIINKFSISI